MLSLGGLEIKWRHLRPDRRKLCSGAAAPRPWPGRRERRAIRPRAASATVAGRQVGRALAPVWRRGVWWPGPTPRRPPPVANNSRWPRPPVPRPSSAQDNGTQVKSMPGPPINLFYLMTSLSKVQHLKVSWLHLWWKHRYWEGNYGELRVTSLANCETDWLSFEDGWWCRWVSWPGAARPWDGRRGAGASCRSPSPGAGPWASASWSDPPCAWDPSRGCPSRDAGRCSRDWRPRWATAGRSGGPGAATRCPTATSSTTSGWGRWRPSASSPALWCAPRAPFCPAAASPSRWAAAGASAAAPAAGSRPPSSRAPSPVRASWNARWSPLVPPPAVASTRWQRKTKAPNLSTSTTRRSPSHHSHPKVGLTYPNLT